MSIVLRSAPKAPLTDEQKAAEAVKLMASGTIKMHKAAKLCNVDRRKIKRYRI